MDPSGGNLVQTFSLGSKAEGFKSRDAEGAGLPTECLFNHKNYGFKTADFTRGKKKRIEEIINLVETLHLSVSI